MLILVVSDFHLGKGKFLNNGQLNILEDFFEDDRFSEFLEFYSTGNYHWKDVHVVLNGDILNTIQIDFEGIYTHIVDEEFTINAIDKIVQGHPKFFNAIKSFLSTPNKRMTYIIGNHDANMAFEKAQIYLKKITHENLNFANEVVEFGVHIEHGHRFEAINTVPSGKEFLEGPNGKQILNLPWGSLFCIFVLPRLKKERPFIDRIRPMSAYVKWTFLNDFAFFIKLMGILINYFFRTYSDDYSKANKGLKSTFKILKQVTIYPKFEKKAKSILMKSPYIHTVVMGHTHLVEWRRFPQGKLYFNCGTWNAIPTMDAAMHEHTQKYNYIYLDIHPEMEIVREASLNNWRGQWKPFQEEVNLST